MNKKYFKKKLEEKFTSVLVFAMIFLLITMPVVSSVSSRTSVQYVPPQSSSDYLSGQGISLTSSFSNEMCGAGQDFVIQIVPLGCEPAVVRSDLLEEQNVPVFCQIAATKINPLIDVDAINGISFRGKLPPGVSGVGYHPAQAAVKSSSSTLLNSPILNNIGYAVIVLKKQRNESSMPDFVEGNLTANIRYDIKNAFGVGEAVYFLSEIKDESDWSQNYKQYGFWKGKGYLRLESISDDSISISVYEDKLDRLTTLSLKKGETSRQIYLRGFYCLAGMQIQLVDLVNPDTTVKINVDGNVYEVRKGEKFLDNKCQLSKEPEKKGLVQKVEVRCVGDDKTETFSLMISPKLEFEINGEKIKVGIGEKIFENYYLGHIDKDKNGNLIVGILNKTSTSEKLGDAEITSFYNSVKASFDKWIKEDDKPKDNSTKGYYFISINQETNIEGNNINLIGFGSAENLFSDTESVSDSDSKFKEYFGNSMKDYQEVIDDYFDEIKIEGDNSESNKYGVEAYVQAIKLADATQQNQKKVELCSEMKEKYSGAFNEIGLGEICGDEIMISNSESNIKSISVGGLFKEISFEGISEPSEEDYSAKIFIGNRLESFTKREIARLNTENESLQLISLNSDSAQVKLIYNSAKSSEKERLITRTGTLKKDVAESFGSNYRFVLSEVNLKKIAKVSVIPNINNVGTQAEFSFKIGIEKRAIELTPDEVKKKIKSLNKTINDWEEISESMGNVIKGLKAACVGVQAFLTVKSFFAGFNGQNSVRPEVTNVYRNKCAEEIKGTSKTMDQCLLEKNDEINSDVKKLSELRKKKNNLNLTNEIENIGSEFGNQITKSGDNIKPIIIDADLKKVFTEDGLKEGKIQASDAQRLWELNQIINDKSVSKEFQEQAIKERYQIVSKIEKDSKNFAQMSDAQEKWETNGLDTSINVLETKETKKAYYTGGDFDKQFGSVPANQPVQGVNYLGNIYLVQLKPVGNNNYIPEKVFDANGGDTVSDEISGKIKSTYSNFEKVDASSYKNKYKNPEVKYYEVGSAKGYPQIVPIDINSGWYAATRPVGGQNLKAYTEAGQPVNFYVGNVMDNGVEEFDISSGDDEYRSFSPLTGVIYGNFPGLNEAETVKLTRKALSAIQEAQKKYKSGLSGDISILGNKVKVGKPAVDLPGANCQDVMSPKDCALMFNVCDPVMCPASRCNLGGNYYVDDVIASGIVGSLALCLPNWKPFGGDVYIPICLSGIKAGIDGLLSILKNYQSCLQHNLETGEYVGICDEVYSIYLCEFFWRQALPLTKMVFTKIIGGIFSGGSKGGGEYLDFASAWQGAENSASYITQHYAVNSFKAFKVRSTEEAGTEVCKAFISARYPVSGEFFDALIEPDVPVQFHAWFDEIPFTTATVPPTSQYKVFYHIYAGKDIGVNFQVYLKSPEGTTLYHTNPRIIVGSGFIPRGQAGSETRDFTASSGYQELCVSVNNKEECGFKQVSTSFALDYIKDQYVAEQVANTNIKSESECISGSVSILGLASSPNIQEGANTAISPNIIQNGIVRVCSTSNPGQGTDSRADTNESRWVAVGNCGNDKLKCWLDTNSVKEAIDIKYIENEALKTASEKTIEDWNKQLNESRISPEDENAIEEGLKSSDESVLLNVIRIIDNNLDKVILNRDRAQLLIWRGNANGKIAMNYLEKLKKDRTEKIENAGDKITKEPDDGTKVTDNKNIWIKFEGYWYLMEEDSDRNLIIDSTTEYSWDEIMELAPIYEYKETAKTETGVGGDKCKDRGVVTCSSDDKCYWYKDRWYDFELFSSDCRDCPLLPDVNLENYKEEECNAVAKDCKLNYVWDDGKCEMKSETRKYTITKAIFVKNSDGELIEVSEASFGDEIYLRVSHDCDSVSYKLINVDTKEENDATSESNDISISLDKGTNRVVKLYCLDGNGNTKSQLGANSLPEIVID